MGGVLRRRSGRTLPNVAEPSSRRVTLFFLIGIFVNSPRVPFASSARKSPPSVSDGCAHMSSQIFLANSLFSRCNRGTARCATPAASQSYGKPRLPTLELCGAASNTDFLFFLAPRIRNQTPPTNNHENKTPTLLSHHNLHPYLVYHDLRRSSCSLLRGF